MRSEKPSIMIHGFPINSETLMLGIGFAIFSAICFFRNQSEKSGNLKSNLFSQTKKNKSTSDASAQTEPDNFVDVRNPVDEVTAF